MFVSVGRERDRVDMVSFTIYDAVQILPHEHTLAHTNGYLSFAPLLLFSSPVLPVLPYLPFLSLHSSCIAPQDDADLVLEFVENQGLNALVTVARDSDASFQQYILKGYSPHSTYMQQTNT